ncbi:MAG: hypothetical protein AAFU59_03910 [Pseudomonadota bacterium]
MTPFMQMDFQFNPTALQPRRDEPFMEYWLSLSPMAPVFGVEWRLPKAMWPAETSPSAPTAATPPALVEDAEVVEEMAEETVVEMVEAVDTGEETAAEAADGIEAILLDTAPAGGSDLSEIKGIGPKLASDLNEMGLYTIEQISKLAEDDLDWIDDRLNSFKGRSRRDDWIGQAKAMLAG